MLHACSFAKGAVIRKTIDVINVLMPIFSKQSNTACERQITTNIKHAQAFIQTIFEQARQSKRRKCH